MWLAKSLPFTAAVSTIKQGLLVLGDQSFRSASTFVSALLVGRACAPSEYGFYTLLLTLLVTTEAFQSALVSTPYVVQSPSQAGPARASYLGNAVLIQFLTAAATAIPLAGLLYVLPRSESGGLSPWMIPAFAAAHFGVLLREFLRQVLLADFRVGWNLVFGCSVHGSLIAVLFGLARAQCLNAWTAYASIAGCSLVPALVVLWSRRHGMRLDRRGLRSQLLDHWRIGRWLFAQAAVQVISGPMPSWVLASSRGAAAVGLLGACLLPGSLLSPLVQAIYALLLPKASHAVLRGLDDVRRMVLRSSLTVGLTLMTVPIVLGWFSTPIMNLLFAGKYEPSSWLVMILALRMYLVVTGAPLSAGLIACRQAYAVFQAEMIALILMVLVGLPLTLVLGVWGVAWAFLLTRLSSRLYLAWAFHQHIRSSRAVTPVPAGDVPGGLAVADAAPL